ncbi:MAG TPA: CHAT domain-containing protein, partial [Pyrinomonadaceae bacterium]|nr:CHAT domain-containing protein [Pyrinomonadaceae bacterium]
REEVRALAPLFPASVALLDEQATAAAVRLHAPEADVLHLACHGRFRPDNPLFSSLRLADGWLTVREAAALELRCGLVALSACETGVSAVAPGDELIGLARGFFAAGAPSLVLSLWTVDDAATADLMTDFYTRLRGGDGPAAALRHAQLHLLKRQPHPFFWSPFVLLGRW